MSDPKIQLYAALLRDEHFDIFYDASTLIVVCSIDEDRLSAPNWGLAAQNPMLEACERGLEAPEVPRVVSRDVRASGKRDQSV